MSSVLPLWLWLALAAPPEPPTIAWRSADPAVLERIIEESEVETGLPRPGAWRYFQDTLETAFFWLTERLKRFSFPPGWESALRTAAIFAVTLAVLLLSFILGRYVIRRLKRKANARQGDVLVGERAAAPRKTDRDEWRRELEKRLAGSDGRRALEAVWWWLASSILGAAVDPSWTNRELLSRAGRPDLSSHARQLDRMRYGTTLPSVEEVKRFVATLESELA